MRAFVVKELGQPGHITEVPDPQPAEGEVLVRVRAASVNPMDAFVVSGGTRAFSETRTPLIPGIDAAGVVESVAPGGNGFKPGDEVVILADVKPYWGEGAFAEKVAMPVAGVVHKPAAVSDEVAASLPLTGLTALGVLDQLEGGAGNTIAAIGATGGVGSWFTQLAALRGAKVIALARSENADYARALGATEVVDYTDASSINEVGRRYPNGIDAIADFSGSVETIEAVVPFVRVGGKLVSTALMVDPTQWAGRGVTAEQGKKAAESRLSELLELLAEGRLQAPEMRVVDLQHTGEAIQQVGQRHNRGKVIVRVAT